jgi:hypothetical protein
LPSLLIGAVMGACDEALASLRDTGMPPVSTNVMPVSERFRRFGADEWNALRTRFRDPVESVEPASAP